MSPANPNYTVEELAFQLKDSGAKAVVTQLPYIKNAQEAARKVGIPLDRVIIIGDQKDPSYAVKHFTSIINTAGSTKFRRTKAKNPAEDLAFLVYSSGTTGHPKGVMLTHRNIVANTMMIKAAEAGNLQPTGGPTGEGDKLLGFLPFFHIYGMWVYYGSVWNTNDYRSHLYDPPNLVFWSATRCHAQIRSRRLLSIHSRA